MENVVKLGEFLGKKHQEAAIAQKEAETQRDAPQKMTTAQIKKFSRDNAYVSYHDVITADEYRPLLRRVALNKELRVNYGKLVDLLKSYGVLRKRTEYGVVFHEEARMYSVYEVFGGKNVLLVKSSECAQVWDW